ncbi:Uncharacterized protein T01_13836, partial [Trichinella spiralis]
LFSTCNTMASGRRSGIVYSKPQEPPFLRAIKEKLGYKPPPTIDSKRQAATSDDADSRPDGPEDQPTVVVLQEGDLTMEEYKEKVKQLAENEERKKIERGDITFQKPSSKESKSSCSNERKRKHTDSILSKDEQMSRLLSFNDDEEEEEEEE